MRDELLNETLFFTLDQAARWSLRGSRTTTPQGRTHRWPTKRPRHFAAKLAATGCHATPLRGSACQPVAQPAHRAYNSQVSKSCWMKTQWQVTSHQQPKEMQTAASSKRGSELDAKLTPQGVTIAGEFTTSPSLQNNSMERRLRRQFMYRPYIIPSILTRIFSRNTSSKIVLQEALLVSGNLSISSTNTFRSSFKARVTASSIAATPASIVGSKTIILGDRS